MTPPPSSRPPPYIPPVPLMHPSDQAQLYCRAPNFYPKTLTHLTPEKVTEWLKKAADYAPQLNLYWDYIDKPTDGQVILVWIPANLEQLPPDGYNWLDSEKSFRLPSLEGRELICYELKQGFLQGEQVTSMSRRRYRLKGEGANDCLMLLHYRRSEDADCVLVDETQVKTPPRRYPLAAIPPSPIVSSTLSRSQTGQPGTVTASAHSVPRLHSKTPQTPNKKKIASELKPKPSTTLQSEIDGGPEPYGDDLDHLTARDVALERYKRNHEYIAELFSPILCSSLKRPRLDLIDRKQQLLNLMEKDKAEAENLRLNHAHRMNELKSLSAEFWKQYAELDGCETEEDLKRRQGVMEEWLNMRIREHESVRLVNVEFCNSSIGGGSSSSRLDGCGGGEGEVGGMRIEGALDMGSLRGGE